MVDASDLRRGRATANAVWGNKAPVLVGDFLFSRAFQLMVEDGSLRVLEILANASAVIAEGEVPQLVTANDTDTTEEAYLEVIAAKTAALFARRRPDRRRRRRAAASRGGGARGLWPHLGIAFQLVDDALDYSARQAELGKTVGDDFRDGKITLPVLIAFARGGEAERAFWRRTLETQETEPHDLERAQALLARHGAIAETVARGRGLRREGPRQPRRASRPRAPRPRMLDLVDFCIERAY